MMIFKVTINQKGAQRIRAGHPWVFRSDVVKSEEAGPGDVVEICGPKGQFLGQGFFNPRSQITLRLVTRNRDPIDRDFIKRRIQESILRREKAFAGRDAVRLIFGESDFLPSLILDRYKDVLVFQTLSAGMDKFREDLIFIFDDLLKPQAIVERNDPGVRELEGLVRQKGIVRGGLPSFTSRSERRAAGSGLPDLLEIREGDLTQQVDPLEGQKTGLFLDQSDNHLAASRYARGRVLDLFSYQGGFALSVSRVSDEVTAVDSSDPALEVLRRNCERNRIQNIKAVEANGFDFLRECQDKKEVFDTVILDPPPFVKDRKSLTGGLRGYKEINLRAMKILRRGGILISCSCSQNFTPRLFEETLLEAAQDTGRKIQILERRGAAPDHPVLLAFPESFYLQCWIVRAL